MSAEVVATFADQNDALVLFDYLVTTAGIDQWIADAAGALPCGAQLSVLESTGEACAADAAACAAAACAAAAAAAAACAARAARSACSSPQVRSGCGCYGCRVTCCCICWQDHLLLAISPLPTTSRREPAVHPFNS
jgi:hypothetical protein